MTNLKEETLQVLEGLAPVKAYSIQVIDNNYNFKCVASGKGPLTQKDLASLNIEYDAGYGIQQVEATILLEDGSWFTRGEYDGSEWYEYHKQPTITKVLKMGQ